MVSVLKKCISWVMPYSLFVSFRFELKILFSRVLNALSPFYRLKVKRLRAIDNAKIHLGCGPNYIDGWINIDGLSSHKNDLTLDLRRRIPLKDQQAEAIFCEHFVEHLEYPNGVLNFFSECRRMLKDNGILRISVPDAGLYLKKYSQNDDEFFLRERPNCETKMEAVNHVFRQAGQHQWAYDFESMEKLLKKAGFKQIIHQAYTQSNIPNFNKDTTMRSGESLYVEAIK